MVHVRRRQFITLLLGGAAAAWPLAARAQQPGRVWRIGVLETTSMELNAANFEAFRQSLRDLGYIEEQNLIIEYRSAEGRGERNASKFAAFNAIDVVSSTPMRQTLPGCCARTASGHAAAAPPSVAKNFRRSM